MVDGIAEFIKNFVEKVVLGVPGTSVAEFALLN